MPEVSKSPKVHLVTFGCQMNKYDSELLSGKLRAQGYSSVDVPDDADVVALNTCSVRGGAEDRVYGRLGELKRLKKKRPELIVAILGCQAQREGLNLLKRAPHIDIVAGTREFQRLPELVARVRAGERPILAIDENVEVAVDRVARVERSASAFIAVMRGCDLNCTFCIVPTTRGRVKSRTVEDILEEARWLVADGVREISLLGQTVNSYGYDLASPSEAEAMGYKRVLAEGGSHVPEYIHSNSLHFESGPHDATLTLPILSEELDTTKPTIPRIAHLMRRLGELPGLDRIRLVTNHVAYLDDSLIATFAEIPSVMPFLPVPAQSGSDRILKEMRRGYTTDLYRKRIDKLRARVPNIELSSDWIVGFPGETDAEFEKSCDFLREMEFAQNFIFRYSPRPETASFDRAELPEEIVAARNTELLKVAEDVQRKRWARYIHSTRPVLVEKTGNREGTVAGHTPEYLEVIFDGAPALAGEIVNVTITETGSFSARGVLV
ncbi:MAG: MiaB/RimO family radical SAM methylthiotransferase [Planctomycetota bacterium]